MKFDADDPIWTAYALGELSELSETQRAAMDALVARDAEALAFVDEVCAAASALGAELALDDGVALRAEQHAAIEAALAQREPVGAPRSAWERWLWMPSAAAAAAALALAIGVALESERGRPSSVDVATASPADEGIDANHVGRTANTPSIASVATDAATSSAGSYYAASKPVAGAVPYSGGTGGVTEPQEWRSIVNILPIGQMMVKRAGVDDPEQDEGFEALSAWLGTVTERMEQEFDSDDDAAAVYVARIGSTPSIELIALGDPVPNPNVAWQRTGLLPPLGIAGGALVLSPASPTFGFETYGLDPRTFSSATGMPGAESYAFVPANPMRDVADDPLSTFSIDVDTASYSNVRRFVENGSLPPASAVRIEELVNYFRYAYPDPGPGRPFSVTTEVAACPWNAQSRLVRIGLKGLPIERDERATSNLVFLIDVSGSMQPENKLPLVQRALRMLVRELGENDNVGIVTYADEARLVLPPTNCSDQPAILAAIESLAANGSTNGAGGIELAYELADRNFTIGGTNRVILCTDGDFNVGTTDGDALVELIRAKKERGVFLSVLGFGMGNLKDDRLEQLADEGDGHYAYVDDLAEARKVLVEELGATLVTIAKDVKIQVEMNPLEVASFRLVGYENRVMAHADFANDAKDAGEIGAGHTVTALYEIVLAQRGVAPDLRYQRTPLEPTDAARSGELLTVKLRYKQPDGDESELIEHAVVDSHATLWGATDDFRFAAAVAGFGLLLRGSADAAALDWDAVLELAQAGLGDDATGRRTDFVDLVRKARALAGGGERAADR